MTGAPRLPLAHSTRRLLTVAAGLAVPAALAGSAHLVGGLTITQSGNTLTVSGREARLGDESQVHIVVSATAECINPGSHDPKATNKTGVSAGDTFPVQNGHADFSLTATATFQPDCTPPMTVVFTNITVTDTGNGIVLYP